MGVIPKNYIFFYTNAFKREAMLCTSKMNEINHTSYSYTKILEMNGFSKQTITASRSLQTRYEILYAELEKYICPEGEEIGALRLAIYNGVCDLFKIDREKYKAIQKDTQIEENAVEERCKSVDLSNIENKLDMLIDCINNLNMSVKTIGNLTMQNLEYTKSIMDSTQNSNRIMQKRWEVYPKRQ